MINLEEYGFVKTSETDRWIDYEGHGFTVTVYNYMVTTFDKVEIIRNTFVVSSRQFTSSSRPIEQLADWLAEKNIKSK